MTRKNQNSVSTPNASVQKCDCASSSTWMTQLFDGQSTPAQTKAAHAHLKSCTSCQRVWREWSRTRSLLREVPAAVAPSSLMDRVLLSCRLLSSQDAAAQSALENEIAHEELARYINAPEAEYSAAFDAPLVAYYEAAPVPANLKARILQLTTEAAAQRAKTPVSVASTLAPIWQNWSETAREWSSPRSNRWSFALAVPAMAALIFMVAPLANFTTSSTIAPNIQSPSTPSGSAQTSASDSTFQASFFQNLLPKISENMTIPRDATKPKAAIAAKPTEKAVVDAAPSFANREFTNDRPAASLISVESDAPFAARLANYPPSIPIKETPQTAPTAKPEKINRVTPKIRIHRKPVMNIRFSKKSPAPSVSFSNNARVIAASLLKRLPSNDERPVSTIENVEERNTAPVLIATVIDFDETFASVGRLRDDRPEELGRAFDSYRASLTNPNNDDEFIDEDLDGQL